MRTDECFEWARRHHGLGRTRAVEEVRAVLDALASSAPPGRLATNHFQACLNDRDLFGVVKLVHVAEPPAPPPRGGAHVGGADLVLGRRKALRAVFRRLNRERGTRFDDSLLDRVYGAIVEGGAGGWYPIFGFEFHPDGELFPEISLYAEHRAPQAALAAARAMPGVDVARVEGQRDRIFALGLDFLADGGARFKLYLDTEPAAAAGLLHELDARLHPARSLTLLRTRPEGGFEERSKAYVPLQAREPGRITDLAGEDFPNVARGRLLAFARRVARAVYGYHLFYIGASEEKIEVYFGSGNPVGDPMIRRAAEARESGR
ncbi:MAG: hypothetical protein ABII00_02505 [Elusimicrobiota bacterium]